VRSLQWACRPSSARDIKQAAATALATPKIGENVNPLDKDNPWAVFDNYIDCVAAQCVNTLTPKWFTKLAGDDVFIWDQCYSMSKRCASTSPTQ
jgi:hypothetical protein